MVAQEQKTQVDEKKAPFVLHLTFGELKFAISIEPDGTTTSICLSNPKRPLPTIAQQALISAIQKLTGHKPTFYDLERSSLQYSITTLSSALFMQAEVQS
ncbi:MAG: hypothetical protein A2103_01950 [Gammaproteobacteria bacterium GWF2_41_13]|nr:MAG: hypothetical protein A2103_01950 [Gammaproteobacteria bacterium GWF2_41_13]